VGVMIRSYPPHPNPLPPGERVGHSSPQQSWGVFWHILIIITTLIIKSLLTSLLRQAQDGEHAEPFVKGRRRRPEPHYSLQTGHWDSGAGRNYPPLAILFLSWTGKEGLPACAKPRLQKPCGGQALRRRQGGDFQKNMSNQLWTP